MSVLTHPAVRHESSDPQGDEARRPQTRIIAASLATGALTALMLTLVVFAGAQESIITGSTLVAFGSGWALLGLLTVRLTNRPQRWAFVPAIAMAVPGLALLVFQPGDAGLSAMGWIWPPAVLALAVWTYVQVRRSLSRRGRRLLTPVVALLAIAALGGVGEKVGVLHDQHAYTAHGKTYDVGGHRLYLDCQGQGSPTVVLSNGMGEVAASWARIVGQVDISTMRVCAYDRAGQGWSQDADHPQDGLTAAEELHTLLDVAGEHGPYVMVGHSTGGTYAMTYAAQYPDQVAGMVLLDSSSPEQFTALPSFEGQYAVMRRGMALLPSLDRLGVGRLVAAVSGSGLDQPAAAEVTALTASAHGARNVRDEVSMLPEIFAQAQSLKTFDDRPLAVLTATESRDQTAGWAAAQDQLAALSTNTVHRVVDSTHEGLLVDQHGSAEAVRAIEAVVTSVTSGSPLPTE